MGQTKIVNAPIVDEKSIKVNSDSTVSVVGKDEIQRISNDLILRIQKLENRVQQLEDQIAELQRLQGG